jgi:hypothetical protein
MAHQDAQMSDIVVVIDDPAAIDSIVEKIKSVGATIESVDHDEGTIEGTLETAKVKDVKAIPGIKYVRSVFNYEADYPVGDPRNQDAENCDEDIPR